MEASALNASFLCLLWRSLFQAAIYNATCWTEFAFHNWFHVVKSLYICLDLKLFNLTYYCFNKNTYPDFLMAVFSHLYLSVSRRGWGEGWWGEGGGERFLRQRILKDGWRQGVTRMSPLVFSNNWMVYSDSDGEGKERLARLIGGAGYARNPPFLPRKSKFNTSRYQTTNLVKCRDQN